MRRSAHLSNGATRLSYLKASETKKSPGGRERVA